MSPTVPKLRLMGTFIPIPPPAEFWRWAAEQHSPIVDPDVGVQLVPKSARVELAKCDGESDEDTALHMVGWARLALVEHSSHSQEEASQIIQSWIGRWQP